MALHALYNRAVQVFVSFYGFPRKAADIFQLMERMEDMSSLRHLARGSVWDTLAVVRVRSTSDVNSSPGPVAAASAENVDVDTVAGDGTGNTVDGEVGDGDTVSWGTGWGSVLVILLDDNTVVGDVAESDVLVGDTGDGSSGIGDSLDTDTVLRVADSAVGDGNSVNVVVVTASNGSDGETVSSRAGSAGERDAGSGVDGEAVVLVLADSVGDGDVRGRSDIEAVSVVSSISDISSGVVDGDRVDSQSLGGVDGDGLDWGVLDVQAGDGRRSLQAVGVEELWLGNTSVGSLTIP